MAYYLTKRTDENQCTVGERCMVLNDTVTSIAGSKGTLVEIYDGGVSVQWDKNGMGQIGTCGFARDDLDLLAFETKRHPSVNPEVTRNQ